MRQIGLRAEVLLNILFITAVAMFLIGIIAFKLTERYAVQGKIEGVKATITALEDAYLEKNDTEGGIEFLKKTLNPGAWGVIAESESRTAFGVSAEPGPESRTDPLILEALNSGAAVVEVEGINFPPFSTYQGVKIAEPVEISGSRKGAVLIYQPLSSMEESLALGQRLLALWIILFLAIIALFGFYILSRRIIKPVHELIKTTQVISSGKFPLQADTGNVKEINQLYLAMKKMYGEIDEGKKELTGKIEELEDTNTKLRMTRRELIEAEKLASLGQLSAGIAHEIGNPLSALNGYIDVLRRSPDMNEENRMALISEIQGEVGRIDRIIRTLLDYSRPKSVAPRLLDVNRVIEDTVEIVKTQGALKGITLRLELSEDIPHIVADAGQLSQVIINLLLNSRDAVSGSGQITITSEGSQVSGVLISVTDNGTGIPEHIRDKIFDPFFTTKEPGHGTGLGLSVSARIIEAFDGKISVDSKEGRGTTFEISFPSARDYENAENFGS